MISECHKSEIEKWEIQHITVELERAQRVDLVDMCPAFDFVLKRLDIHTLDSKLKYMITIIISRLPCYVFCICMLTNKYQKYNSVELGDQLE